MYEVLTHGCADIQAPRAPSGNNPTGRFSTTPTDEHYMGQSESMG